MIHHCTVVGADVRINAVSTVFSNLCVPVGTEFAVWVFDDPLGNGNPTQADIVNNWTTETAILTATTGVRQTVPLSNPIIATNGSYFIVAAVSYHVPPSNGYPHGADITGPDGEAYYCFYSYTVPDPEGPLFPFDPTWMTTGGYNAFTAGDWMVRADADEPSPGSCCDPSIPSCTDNVIWSDCLAPGQVWTENVACAALDPLCGYGACCYGDGLDEFCVVESEADCTARTNEYLFHLHENCEDVSCARIPENDTCVAAEVLPSDPCVNVTFDSSNAISDTLGDPASCTASDDVPAGYPVARDVWYRYQIPADYNGETIDPGSSYLVISTYGSTFDTILQVFWDTSDVNKPCTGGGALECPPGTGTVTENLCNDDVILGTRLWSRIEFNINGGDKPGPGDCIIIRVGGWFDQGAEGGVGALNIQMVPVTTTGAAGQYGVCCDGTGGCTMQTEANCATYFRPWTDFYENARYDSSGTDPDTDPLLCGDQDEAYVFHAGCCTYEHCAVGSACYNPIPITGSGTHSIHNVTYYSFTAPGSGAVLIDTCGTTDFDTVISVYSGDPTALEEPGAVYPGNCKQNDPYLIKRNDDCTRADEPASCGLAPCHDDVDTYGESCLCLTVGLNGFPDPEDTYDLLPSQPYIIGVGMKDDRVETVDGGPCREEGIDPVPNYPMDGEFELVLNIDLALAGCYDCEENCVCRGDFNGSSDLDGDDIQGFVDAFLATPADCTTNEWCKANMNGDCVLSTDDVPIFVNLLLAGASCTADPLDCANPDACHIPDFDTDIALTNDSTQCLFDNFSPVTYGILSEVCWWGIYSDSTAGGECPTLGGNADDFQVAYFDNYGADGLPNTADDGTPGNAIAEFSQSATTLTVNTKTSTLVSTVDAPLEGYNVFEFTASHAPINVFPDECYWIRMANYGVDASCTYSWLSADGTGDDINAFIPGGGDCDSGYAPVIPSNALDMAFCVNVDIKQFDCADTSCVVDCGDATKTENEPTACPDGDDTYNAGCNSTPESFNGPAIVCGDIVCGTSGSWITPCPGGVGDCAPGDTCTDGYCEGTITRDTDWYVLDLAAQTLVTLTIADDDVEFPWIMGFAEYLTNPGSGDCADLSGYIFPNASGIPCAGGEVEVCLPAGIWWVFVAPRSGWLIPCDSAYKFSVSCDVCTNDECEQAEEVFPGTSVFFSTSSATTDVGDVGISCNYQGVGVPMPFSLWYYFVATATTAKVDTCLAGTTAGDTILACFDDCDQTTELGCCDDAGCGPGGYGSCMTLTGLVVDTTYYIQVGSNSAGFAGPVEMLITSPDVAPACPATGPGAGTCN
ncbi:MAG: hypothetical protein ABII12_09635 [Planctomycetota bacterium]